MQKNLPDPEGRKREPRAEVLSAAKDLSLGIPGGPGET